MGSDDMFKHRGDRHHENHGYYGGQRNDHHDHHSHHGGIERYLYLFEKLKGNKKLLLILAIAALVIAIVVISALVMLMPLLMKLLASIDKNGIKGLVETVRPLLELLWSGAGK